MNITVKTTITDNRIPMIIAAFPGLMEQAVAKTAFDIQEMAQSIAPVDTGYMAGTIWADVDGLRAEIKPEAEYAGYVEFGTYKMAAQPFMRPAADANEANFAALISQVVAGLMG